MEEQQASRLAPSSGHGRARRTRLALLVQVVALAAHRMGWVQLAPARTSRLRKLLRRRPPPRHQSRRGINAIASTVPRPTQPTQAFGLDVQPLDDVQLEGFEAERDLRPQRLVRPTAITDCPRLAAIYQMAPSPTCAAIPTCWRSARAPASSTPRDQTSARTGSPSDGPSRPDSWLASSRHWRLKP